VHWAHSGHPALNRLIGTTVFASIFGLLYLISFNSFPIQIDKVLIEGPDRGNPAREARQAIVAGISILDFKTSFSIGQSAIHCSCEPHVLFREPCRTSCIAALARLRRGQGLTL
jgi:hypothetical protein